MKVNRSYRGTSSTSQMMNQETTDDNEFDIDDLPEDLREEYVKYLIMEVINTTKVGVTADPIKIDKSLLDKFAIAILDSENLYVDIPVYISLLTMILNQEYNIEINSVYDRIVSVLLRTLKA